jgi:tRNA 5-methylaminomethyl-2-thiouridine biosynthesis bifunctional protein
VVGATTTFNDESTDLRELDHADNLAKLAMHVPALHRALSISQLSENNSIGSEPVQGASGATMRISTLEGRAGVRCSVPGATPLVGEVEPGLYCSLAHGTRGLLTAGVAGEVLAAAMCGHLAPLPQVLLDALMPLPRIRHQG